jgi:hypothetical protein
MECGGRAQRRHRFGFFAKAKVAGVAKPKEENGKLAKTQQVT